MRKILAIVVCAIFGFGILIVTTMTPALARPGPTAVVAVQDVATPTSHEAVASSGGSYDTATQV